MLKTKAGLAIAQGAPIDMARMTLFGTLATALRTAVLPDIVDVAVAGDSRIHFAFLESYFSNYVEGTRFSVEEAGRHRLAQSDRCAKTQGFTRHPGRIQSGVSHRDPRNSAASR